VHGEDLERVVRRRPFRPFRIALSNNEQFDVVHPDLVIVDDRFVAVGSPRGADPDDDELLVYWIDLNHIVYVRRL
jgi:phosphatidylserine/phosphatidylglycerophosphate/cardiolipin synthase-like enzyme